MEGLVDARFLVSYLMHDFLEETRDVTVVSVNGFNSHGHFPLIRLIKTCLVVITGVLYYIPLTGLRSWNTNS